ncbi:hypothetical protein HF319_13500, partial [Xanthomonas sp. Kuri4-1]
MPIRVLSVAESSDGSASGEVEAALADTVSVPSAGRGRAATVSPNATSLP